WRARLISVPAIRRGLVDDRAHVSATWQCGALGQLRLRGFLVYAASEGGAREVATWVIMSSVCAAAIVFGSVVQYILGWQTKKPKPSLGVAFSQCPKCGPVNIENRARLFG